MDLVGILTLIRRSSFFKGLVVVVSFPFLVVRAILREINVSVSRWYARLESTKLLKYHAGGRVPDGSSSSICILAHYDRDNLVDDYVVQYLSALVDAGCDIVFVSTAKPGDRQIEKIVPFCVDIIVRPNLGYDFGSYRTGLEYVHGRLANYSRVILANDSVYGPLYSLRHILDDMSSTRSDVWSITDSWEHGYHLQSYFLVIRDSVFTDDRFWQFVYRIGYLHRTKRSVIRDYEVKLTRHMLRLGFAAEARIPYTEVRDRLLKKYPDYAYNWILDTHYVNPTHFFWFSLIKDFEAPFIKVELIRDNPQNLEGVAGNWRKLVDESEYPDSEIIMQHLKRMGAGGGSV